MIIIVIDGEIEKGRGQGIGREIRGRKRERERERERERNGSVDTRGVFWKQHITIPSSDITMLNNIWYQWILHSITLFKPLVHCLEPLSPAALVNTLITCIPLNHYTCTSPTHLLFETLPRVIVQTTPGLDVAVPTSDDSASVPESCDPSDNFDAPPLNFELFQRAGFEIDWCRYVVSWLLLHLLWVVCEYTLLLCLHVLKESDQFVQSCFVTWPLCSRAIVCVCSIKLLMYAYLTLGLYSHVNSHDSGVAVGVLVNHMLTRLLDFYFLGLLCMFINRDVWWGSWVRNVSPKTWNWSLYWPPIHLQHWLPFSRHSRTTLKHCLYR